MSKRLILEIRSYANVEVWFGFDLFFSKAY